MLRSLRQSVLQTNSVPYLKTKQRQKGLCCTVRTSGIRSNGDRRYRMQKRTRTKILNWNIIVNWSSKTTKLSLHSENYPWSQSLEYSLSFLDLVKFDMRALVSRIHMAFLYLQMGKQSLETRVQMTNLTRSKLSAKSTNITSVLPYIYLYILLLAVSYSYQVYFFEKK